MGYGGKGKAGPAGGQRKLVSSKRVGGTVVSISGNVGWIEATEKVSHPKASMNGGRIFMRRRDVRPDMTVEIGTSVDFFVYADEKGLGAGDIRSLEGGMAMAVEVGGGHGLAQVDVLPEGWERVWSEEHQEYYWWNKATKKSSWTKPSVREDDDEDKLPKGWKKVWSDEHEEYYYWHKETKQSSWDAPAREQPEDGEEEAPAEEEEEPEDAEAAARAKKAPVLGQQRIPGHVSEWEGFFGWIVPTKKLVPELQGPLEQSNGKIYVNWRDVQKELKMKVGLEVEFSPFLDDNGIGAKDVGLPHALLEEEEAALAELRDGIDELDRAVEQWAREDARKEIQSKGMKAAMRPVESVEDQDEVEAWPLLPGWEELWSEEHGCLYYWHKKTKTSSWERPAVAPAPGSREEKKFWEGEGAEEGAARTATPITPVAGQPGSMTPYTPGVAGAKMAAAAANKESQSFRSAQASGVFKGRGWQPDNAQNGIPKWQKPAAPAKVGPSAAPGKGTYAGQAVTAGGRAPQTVPPPKRARNW
jgi:hypothetical protein